MTIKRMGGGLVVLAGALLSGCLPMEAGNGNGGGEPGGGNDASLPFRAGVWTGTLNAQAVSELNDGMGPTIRNFSGPISWAFGDDALPTNTLDLLAPLNLLGVPDGGVLLVADGPPPVVFQNPFTDFAFATTALEQAGNASASAVDVILFNGLRADLTLTVNTVQISRPAGRLRLEYGLSITGVSRDPADADTIDDPFEGEGTIVHEFTENADGTLSYEVETFAQLRGSFNIGFPVTLVFDVAYAGEAELSRAE